MAAAGPATIFLGVLMMAATTVPVCGYAALHGTGGGQAVCTGRQSPVTGDSCSEDVHVEDRLDFDIQPQALDLAIEAYSAVTGQSVIYDSRLTAGIMSMGAEGRYAAAEAMARILDGSGLVVRKVDDRALVLARENAATGAASMKGEPVDSGNYGAIQKRVNEAFCRWPELAEGRHRLALQFWFAADGRPSRVRLLESSGDPRFDGAVHDAMRDVEIGAAAADRLAQPVTMLILPRSSGYEWGCPPFGRESRASP